MSLFFGLLGPALGLGIQFYVWLYVVPLILLFAGWHFIKAAFHALMRHDLPFKARVALAWNASLQGLAGFASSALVAVLIFHRVELFECVAGLF